MVRELAEVGRGLALIQLLHCFPQCAKLFNLDKKKYWGFLSLITFSLLEAKIKYHHPRELLNGSSVYLRFIRNMLHCLSNIGRIWT